MRRAGRMTRRQQYAYTHYYDQYCISYTPHFSIQYIIDFFPYAQDIILELGFGMGHATAQIAHNFSQYNFIGIEVYPSGIASLLDQIQEYTLQNVCIIPYDAKYVLPCLYNAHMAGVHIFFPDPWQKKRHHKRRIIQMEFFNMMVRILRNNAYIYIVTDWQDYAEYIITLSNAHPHLINPYNGYAPPQLWRPKTAFEQKGLVKNHHIYEIYLTINKLNGSDIYET